jgi:plastocyanin
MMALLTVAAACGETTPPNGGPVETREVSIVDTPAFEPPDIIVAEGDTVTWTWNGFQQHQVVFDAPGFPPSPAQSLGMHQVVFGMAGTYTYFCSVHGRAAMSGSVTVTAQAPEP